MKKRTFGKVHYILRSLKKSPLSGKKGGLFEPREGLVFDANGDGLDDLVFLVHNRLLLYKQTK